MGFYGNITNNTRSSFKFDRTYPNRAAMDAGAATDGVLVGRYVLVDYDFDREIQNSDTYFVQAYKWLDETGDESILRFGPTQLNGALFSALSTGTIIVVPGKRDGDPTVYNGVDTTTTVDEYYKCTGKENGINTFDYIDDDMYGTNYRIDVEAYGKGRGYDSTAWQKVYIGNDVKYVMVAELNSVVPSFGITADAPSMIPLQPHWGADSTNVYYNLHWPVAWGMRLKAAKKDTTVPNLDSYGRTLNDDSRSLASSDIKDYPYDVTTVWKKIIIDPETEERSVTYSKWNGANKIDWVDNEADAIPQPAAIYFNEAGLDSERIVYSKDKKYAGWGSGATQLNPNNEGYVTNQIGLNGTGRSGFGYNSHSDNTKDYDVPDSMELSVMLPALGDAVAEAWDLVYGNRKANANMTEDINGTKYRNKDITWEDGRYAQERTGLRLVSDVYDDVDALDDLQSRYRPDRVETVAGAINSVHDLMGMIIVPATDTTLWENVDSLDENRIYYNKDDGQYYRKKTSWSFEPLLDYYVNNGTEIGDSPYLYIDVTNEITEDNFDPHLLFTYVQETIDGNLISYYKPLDLTSTTVYDSNVTYYARTYKNIVAPYLPANVHNYDPTKYWFLDYAGDRWGSEVRKQDFIQSLTYEYGKQYYTISPAPRVITGLSEVAYAENTYWYIDNNGDFVLDDSEDVTPGRRYLTIPTLANNSPYFLQSYTGRYQGIYTPGKYYYEANNGQYKLSNAEAMPVNVHNEYEFYLPKENVSIIGSGNNGTTYTRTVILYNVSISKANRPTAAQDFPVVDASNYTPNTYYILADGENVNINQQSSYTDESKFVLEGENSVYDAEQTYWMKDEILQAVTNTADIIDFSKSYFLLPYTSDTYYTLITENDIKKYRSVPRADIKPGNMSYYVFWCAEQDANFAQGSGREQIINSIFDWKANLYHTFDAQNAPALLSDTSNNYAARFNYQYYQIHQYDDFFERGRYHKRIQNSDTGGYNYILATEKRRDLDATYVEILNDNLHEVDPSFEFYSPYKYYEKIGDVYHLVITDEPPYQTTREFDPSTNSWSAPQIVYQNGEPQLTQLYKKNCYYVWGDTTGIHKIGEEWNPNIKWIPSSVELAVRSEYNILEALPGFARSLSTIHGMLLKLWQLLELNDDTTRDLRTAHGLMNSMNDILAKIHELVPGYLTYVNDYGQISSTPVETDEWIDITINSRVKDPSIIIQHHDIHTQQNTTSNSNVNENGDTINLYTPLLDTKGHVVGKNIETVTLPYGFKTISVTNSSAASVYEDPVNAVTNHIVADNTQDTFSINAGNKWVRFATDATNDALTIAHATLTPTTSALTAIDQNALVNNAINDTITVYEIDTDNAGHVTHNQPKEITLPYGFKTIAASNSPSTIIDAPSVTSTVQVADNTQDTLTFAGSNKWIKIDNATEDTVKIGHAVPGVTEVTNSPSNGDNISNAVASEARLISGPEPIKFPVDTVEVDQAGHITTHTRTHWLMPNGFKEVLLVNPANINEAISVAARGTADSVSLLPDTWVTLSKDSNATQQINIGHSAAHNDGQNATSINFNAQTPNFGATFDIPTFVFDTKGHLYNHSTATVTIPLLSLTNGSGNVVTGISLPTPSTGAFTETKANVGTLQITGYSIGNTVSPLAATDTINDAFGKLEYKLNDEITNRGTAITNAIAALDMPSTVTASTGEIISSINETDGIVTASTRALTASDIPDISATYLTTTAAANTYLEQANAFTQTQADALYSPIGALTASSVAGSYTIENEDPITHEITSTPVDVTYSQLYGLIISLNSQITALEARIAALEPVTHNVTITFNGNDPTLSQIAEFVSGSFEGGAVTDGDSITVTIQLIDPNVVVDDWEINGTGIGNTALTYTFVPQTDTTINITFQAMP